MGGVKSTNGLRLAHVIALTFICLSATPVFPSSASGTNARAASIDGSRKSGEYGKPFQRGASSAPVTIVEFSDFQCRFSGAAQSILSDLLRDRPGNIRLVFKNSPLPIHPDALLAHEAALAAGEQGKFWEMHDLIFAHQSQLKMADLVTYAKQLSLKLTVFEDRLASHYYKSFIENDLAEARRLGVDATPTFFVNDKKIVGVSGLKAAVAATLGYPQPTANAETVQLPEQPNIEHSPVRGSTDAPVTIVEFSDFQCPYCAGALPLLSKLLKDYPGQIKLVFKHFPLPFHQDSLLAHEAALAAREQGKFWEMHDLIFANQNALKRDDLVRIAENLGLDQERFTADLDSGRFKTVVVADQDEGIRLGVGATPTLYIDGHQLVGSGSESEIKALIEQALKRRSLHDALAGSANSESEKYGLGPATAPVTILWFTDVQSILAPKTETIVNQLMAAYPGKIRLVLKHCPMDSHPDATVAYQAILAAGAQGKFWEMHDQILSHQNALKKYDLMGYAKMLGLDIKKLASDIEKDTYRPAIESDLLEAQERQVRGTPVFFVNDVRIDGLQTLDSLRAVVVSELRKTSATKRPR